MQRLQLPLFPPTSSEEFNYKRSSGRRHSISHSVKKLPIREGLRRPILRFHCRTYSARSMAAFLRMVERATTSHQPECHLVTQMVPQLSGKPTILTFEEHGNARAAEKMGCDRKKCSRDTTVANTCNVHITVFSPPDFLITSLYVWLYQIHELIFHQSAFHSLDFLVALEYYNCREGSYFEFARPIRVLIRVDLGHVDLVTEFSSHLTNSGAMSLHGSHHVAKTSSNKGVAESVFNSSASCKSVSSPT